MSARPTRESRELLEALARSAPGAERSLDALSRRTFLRLAGAAAAGGLLPSGCGGVPEDLRPPADLRLVQLSSRAYATFNAAAMRMLGPMSAREIAEGRIDPARAADAWMAREPTLAASLGQALLVLEFGVYPLLAKWRPFTQLDGVAQDRVLSNLMLSHVDLKCDLFKGLKSAICIAYYADPASRVVSGFPGPFGGGEVSVADAMRYDVEI